MINTELTDGIENLDAVEVIDRVLAGSKGKACITCSFQAEDMIVLKLLRRRLPDIPVIFLETGYHFRETYAYRDRIAQEWGLNLVNASAEQSVRDQEKQLGILNRTDPGRCCHLRKVEPLMRALAPFDIWFTGLRREQSPTRKNLQLVEDHTLPEGKVLLKVSPLAAWNWDRVWNYTTENGIEYLPLYDLGYRSIGCEPCTSIPAADADPRSGRWGGAKLECGIHTFLEESRMIEIILGFFIATVVGMTGMGGGSFTTPALILLIGLPAGESVGTAMIFAAILRILAAPFYLVKRNVSLRLLGLLLIGAIPGLLLGTWLLHFLYVESWKSSALVVVGILLTFSAAATFVPRFRNPNLAKQQPRWLAVLSFPIGVEMGFSSAGAGALGTLLMLNFTEMSVPEVVGTDLLFGIALAFVGGAFHFLWGAINTGSLTQLLIGGIPGVFVGCALANRLPAKRVRTAIAVIAVVLGLQLVWSGGQMMVRERASRSAEASAKMKDKDVTAVPPAVMGAQR